MISIFFFQMWKQILKCEVTYPSCRSKLGETSQDSTLSPIPGASIEAIQTSLVFMSLVAYGDNSDDIDD